MQTLSISLQIDSDDDDARSTKQVLSSQTLPKDIFRSLKVASPGEVQLFQSPALLSWKPCLFYRSKARVLGKMFSYCMHRDFNGGGRCRSPTTTFDVL